MAKVGAQDLWVAGSRFYFQRDAIDSVLQPLIDLGRIETAQPTIEPTEIEIFDSDGGVNKKLASQVTQIDETYEITCSNFSPDNLALLFLGQGVQDFSQSAAGVTNVTHWGVPGKLIKIVDSTGVGVYSLGKISGLILGDLVDFSTAVVTDITASTRTLTVSTDLTTELSVGDKVMLDPTNLGAPLNSGTYTVESVTSTTVVVEETLASDESSITGVLVFKGTGDTGEVLGPGVDFEVVSLDRGIVRILETSTKMTTAANLHASYVTAAVTGERLILPQTVAGEVAGQGYLIYGRDNNAAQSVREARMSIVPSGTNLTADDYSNFSLSVSVLSDLLSTGSGVAGRLLSFKGELPDKS